MGFKLVLGILIFYLNLTCQQVKAVKTKLATPKIVNHKHDKLKNQSAALKQLTKDLPFDFDDISKLLHEQFNGSVASQLGFGFLMGYSSGICLKQFSTMLAVVIGAFYMGVQTLSYYGYIQVDANKVEKDFDKLLDMNKDGRVTTDDLQLLYEKYYPIIAYHGPTSGSFTLGFIQGLKK